MITSYEQFIVESAKKVKTLKADLIIVDVQEDFKKYFTDEYVRALKHYCLSFDRTYQVFDNNDQQEATYRFPRQARVVPKAYGFDLDEDDLDDYFLPPVVEDYQQKKNRGLKQGDCFQIKHGDMLVYIGASHDWFQCPQELWEVFETLKKSGRPVYMVGGADGECLTDVFVAAMACGVNIQANKEYIYSAKKCPSFPDFSDRAIAIEKEKADKKAQKYLKKI